VPLPLPVGACHCLVPPVRACLPSLPLPCLPTSHLSPIHPSCSCPPGTYTEATGATSLSACLPAPKGNFAAGAGNDGFTPCLPGTYSDKEGSAACKDCPPGYQCPAGATVATPCRPGFYSDMKQVG